MVIKTSEQVRGLIVGEKSHHLYLKGKQIKAEKETSRKSLFNAMTTQSHALDWLSNS